MRRSLRDAPARLTHACVDADGETLATDVTGVTLTATASSGTALAGSPYAATDDPNAAGMYTATIPATALTDYDVIDLVWNITRTSGNELAREQLAVVGGNLFEAREFRAKYPDFADVNDVPPDELRACRDAITDLFDDACIVSFFPVAVRRTFPGTAGQILSLDVLELIRVRAVKIDGVALTGPELAALDVRNETGLLVRPAGWGTGATRIEVWFEHGLTSVPSDVSTAAMLLASAALAPTAAGDRASSVSTDAGTFRLTTAGRDGLTNFPTVNETLRRWGADSDAFVA